MIASSLLRTSSHFFLRHRATLSGPLLLLLLVVGCSAPPPPRAEKTVEVDVTTPISAEVLDYQDFTGRLEAFRTVDVRPRVTGYIEAAPFKEGDIVKKGDVLYQIDQKKFLADFSEADAALKVAIAERKLQDSNAARARRMVSTRAMGREEFDLINANGEKSASNVVALEAARKRAEIYVNYTRVVAPIDGRISRRYIDPGNLVRADETLLTTVVNDDNVYAYFDVDERTYLDLANQQHSTSTGGPLAQKQFPVLMRLANEDDYTHPGQIDFLDNRLSGNTGTIRMRAVFPNPSGALKSGLFVRIRLPISSFYRTLLIPDEALQSDQGRKFVYVVDADNNVEYRAVTLGQSIQSMRAIREGLAEGDRVIISGMQRVRPKMQVRANVKAPPKAPDYPLGKLMHSLQAAKPAADPKTKVEPPADLRAPAPEANRSRRVETGKGAAK